jgi:hypothetical protein
VGGEVRREVASLRGREHLVEVLGRLDGDTGLVEGGRRIRRGHTHGPKPVALPDRWYELADAEGPLHPDAELATSGG